MLIDNLFIFLYSSLITWSNKDDTLLVVLTQFDEMY